MNYELTTAILQLAPARHLSSRSILPRCLTTHDGEGERSRFQIHREFCSGLGPQSKFPVAGKNHKTDLESGWNNLIVGLQFKGHFIEPARGKWFTPGQRLMV